MSVSSGTSRLRSGASPSEGAGYDPRTIRPLGPAAVTMSGRPRPKLPRSRGIYAPARLVCPGASMGTAINPHSAVCLTLTRAISSTRTVDEIYSAALDALAVGLGVERSSILLFDPDGVMRFKAHRGLSDGYRAAVEGHTPWTPESIDPQPLVVPDITKDDSLIPYRNIIDAER